jgi:hypothetical protein
MTVVLKIDKGTVEKLLQWTEIKSEQSRNLSGKELTLKIDDEEVSLEKQEEGHKRMLEISDVNGSFGLWIELTEEKVQKLKKLLEEY